MRGILCRKMRDDDGMTLVEILIASAIMFIILTGILGLVGQTTRMSAQAKQQNVLTNAVSAYTEWLNTLPFEQVDIVSAGGDGVLDPTHTITLEGYTLVFNPVVTPGENGMLKNVSVDVVITRVDGWSQEVNTSMVIRDRSQFLTQAERDPVTDPVVYFLNTTPPEDAIVWGGTDVPPQWSGGTLFLSAFAEASDGRNLTSFKYLIGGLYACVDIYGNVADWTPDAAYYQKADFIWNTLQDFGGTPMPDGRHVVQVIVLDDANVDMKITRYFRVNNHPPAEPGVPSGKMLNLTRAEVSWAASPAPPGSDPTLGFVSGYELRVYKIGVTNDDRTLVASYSGPNTTFAFDMAEEYTQSRYLAEVRAYGPRYEELGHPGFTSEWVSSTFESRPRLGGTYTVFRKSTGSPKYWEVTANITVSPLGFPTTGGVTYSFYRVVNGALESTPFATGALGAATDTVKVVGNLQQTEFPVTYYTCLVTYTPADGDGVQRTMQSDIVHTAYKNESGTYAFPPGTW